MVEGKLCLSQSVARDSESLPVDGLGGVRLYETSTTRWGPRQNFHGPDGGPERKFRKLEGAESD